MAVGDPTSTQLTRSIKVLEAAIATNGTPIGQGAAAGVSVGEVIKAGNPHHATIFVASTAGSGTMTVTLRAWAMSVAAGNLWAPCGTGSATLRGVLNGGNAIDEVSADLLRHTEVIGAPWAMDRFYLEITAIGGTGTAISAWLTVPAMQS